MSQDTYENAESLFRATYSDLAKMAYKLLENRADAEDAIQNSFCKLLIGWDRIACLSTAGTQRAYLSKIVINEALQILRYPNRRREYLGAELEELGVVEEFLDVKIQAKDDLRLIWKAIGELPDMRRDVMLSFAAGYDYEEIAQMLGIGVSTVRAHMSHARRQLSKALPPGRGTADSGDR